MIAVDTSALVAVASNEREAGDLSRVLAQNRVLVGAPTLLETSMVLPRYLGALSEDILDELLRGISIEPVAFSFGMYDAAKLAFRRYGKGQGNPAQLNFGDCMSYAVAKTLGLPLLFKGDDFTHTDIRSALPR